MKTSRRMIEMKNKKTCFIISPIGKPGSSIRKRSDNVEKFIIRSAMAKQGYETKRADDLAEPGIVTTQVINHLLNDSIVVADLSDQNPNVFYELAIRHVIRKPYIHIIEYGQKLPFNVFPMRTIYYNLKNPEDIERSNKEIEDQVFFIENNPDLIDSPVSYSAELLIRSKSPNAVDRDMASIMHLIQNFQSDFSSFRSEIHQELEYIKNYLNDEKEDLPEKKLDLSKIGKRLDGKKIGKKISKEPRKKAQR